MPAIPPYRIYPIDPAGRISGPAEIVLSDNDKDAIRVAQQAVNGCAIELWKGDRLVVRFPADPE